MAQELAGEIAQIWVLSLRVAPRRVNHQIAPKPARFELFTTGSGPNSYYEATYHNGEAWSRARTCLVVRGGHRHLSSTRLHLIVPLHNQIDAAARETLLGDAEAQSLDSK